MKTWAELPLTVRFYSLDHKDSGVINSRCISLSCFATLFFLVATTRTVMTQLFVCMETLCVLNIMFLQQALLIMFLNITWSRITWTFLPKFLGQVFSQKNKTCKWRVVVLFVSISMLVIMLRSSSVRNCPWHSNVWQECWRNVLVCVLTNIIISLSQKLNKVKYK